MEAIQRSKEVRPKYVAVIDLPAPVKVISLVSDGQRITGVHLKKRLKPTAESVPVLDRAVEQFSEYMAGKRQRFDLPLGFVGTPFQEKVWKALIRIPFGKQKTYGEIAREVGSPLASRAVGGAVGSNPLAVFIPCHRVVGSNGLGGFSGGGLPVKRWLLAKESLA